MSDKGYLSNRLENAIAKLLDDKIDFDEIFKGKKLLGVITIGSLLEKRDRKLFKSMISFIDDNCIGKNPNAEIKSEIDLIVGYIETSNVQAFSDHVADILEQKINLNLGSYERQIYLGFLMLFNGFIGKLFTKIETLIAEANAEA